MEKKITQTAGRTALGEFAPEFAHFNDDVLFGENWNNQEIDVKTRCIITVVALMSSGITDSSLKYHLENAKAHGVTQKEIAAIITHVAFYVGWPKGWAVFNLAKEIWSNGEGDLPYEDEAMRAHAKEAEKAGVQLIFAISPGLDIDFFGANKDNDRRAMINKMELMYSKGIRQFALFFDDIPEKNASGQAAFINYINNTFIRDHEDIKPLLWYQQSIF